jgi:hypothetical protein
MANDLARLPVLFISSSRCLICSGVIMKGYIVYTLLLQLVI